MTRKILSPGALTACAFTMVAVMATEVAVYAQLDAGEDDAGPSLGDAGPETTTPAPIINPAEEDPAGFIAKFYDASRDGEWLVAIGIAAMFFVWGLRITLVGFLKIKFLDTRVGKYLLAYSTAMVITVAVGLQMEQSFSLGLVGTGLAAGWAITGAWNGFRDAIGGLRARRQATP